MSADLRRLLAEATSGPWHTPGISLRPYTIYGPDDDDLARAWEAADAELAAAAVNALPSLLDELDELRSLVMVYRPVYEAAVKVGIEMGVAAMIDGAS